MAEQKTPATPSYENAPEALISLWNLRRRSLALGPEEALPALDCDLAPLLEQRVAAEDPLPPGASAHAKKRYEIRREMVGMTELAALNGLLIAHLRKRRAPRHAAALFRRIWTEQGPALLAELPSRWLISSLITFGDHGATEPQRRIGLAGSIFFSLMKLYEYERLSSGQPADRAFSVRTRRSRGGLPLDMPEFSLLNGGLDVNLLAPLWQMARAEPVAGPIALQLFEALNLEERGLFRRLGRMREDLQDHRSKRSERRARRRETGDNPGENPVNPGEIGHSPTVNPAPD